MEKLLPSPFNLLPSTAVIQYSLEASDTVFQKGESVHGIFYLLDGAVSLTRFTESGSEVVTQSVGAGETFAEAAIFSEIYHCNAIARQPSTLLKISKSEILSLAHNDTSFALALASRFASQVQQLRHQKEITSIRSADQRVYVALSEGLLKGSVKQFANEIGLTHEAVYRALANLVKQERVVKKGRGQYCLKNEN